MEIGFRKTAKQYYSDPNLENLLAAVFKKYQGQGGVRGNAKIIVGSNIEADRLQDFFGSRLEGIIRPNMILEVPIRYFAEELLHVHELTIPDLYELLYDKPLLTNREEKQLKEDQWLDLFDRVVVRFEQLLQNDISNIRFRIVTFDWFERLRDGKALGYQIIKHTLRNGGDAENDLFYCAKALWKILLDKKELWQECDCDVEMIGLPIFAEKITSYPHFFDVGYSSGRLFLSALHDIFSFKLKAGEIKSNESLFVPAFMKDRQVYRFFGLRDDDISSIAHVFASGFIYGTSPRTLNLGEIEAEENWPIYSHIYLFENPSVFSFLVDETIFFLDQNGYSFEQLSVICPPLICTSGQPRSATKYFILKCLEANPNCEVFYSGDFDLHGVQMERNMEKLVQKKIIRYHMDSETYQRLFGPNNKRLSQQDRKILSKMQGDKLAEIMDKAGFKVYQEATVACLKTDWINMISRLIQEKSSRLDEERVTKNAL